MREKAEKVAIQFDAQGALLDAIDRWRMAQPCTPARAAAVKWITEQFLQREAVAPQSKIVRPTAHRDGESRAA